MGLSLVTGLAALLVRAVRRPTAAGRSDELRARIYRFHFRAHTTYEVREMLRYSYDRLHKHRREDEYGGLRHVYPFVKCTVARPPAVGQGGGGVSCVGLSGRPVAGEGGRDGRVRHWVHIIVGGACAFVVACECVYLSV